ncbi:MAG: ABC transporter substrate-binding protein [Brevinema sp.]
MKNPIGMIILLIILLSCGQQGKVGFRIGFATDQNIVPFAVAEVESVRNEAKKRGYTIVYNDAEDDLARHIANIETLIAQNVDYLVFSPINTLAYENILETAYDAKIPTILIDSTVEGKARDYMTTEILSDFVWQGRVAAEWILSNYNGEVTIIELYGGPGASAAIDRNQGFMDVVAQNPRLKVIASQVGAWSRSQGQTVTANILQANRNRKIDVIFSHNDEMALGAVAAVKDTGLKLGEDVVIIGIDGQKENVEAIKQGEIAVTITSNPRFGPMVMDAIVQLKEGNGIPKTYIIQDRIYDINNINEFIDAF